MGEYWQNRTAIYYIMQVEEFSLPWVTKIINSSDLFITFITYFTVLVQLAFPFLLFNKKAKYVVLILLCGMHIGIAFVMGIVTFSLTILLIDAVLISDKKYKWLYNNYRSKFPKEFLSRENSDGIKKKLVENRSLLILYDSWCPVCIKTRKRIEKIDFFKKINFVSLRDDDILRKLNISVEEAEKEMIAVNLNNYQLFHGVNSFFEILKRIPLLWPICPFLYMGILLGLGKKFYRYIADRRNIVPVNKCTLEECGVNKEEV